MSDAKIPQEKMKKMLKTAGVGPDTEAISRRRWPRYETTGTVLFHRQKEKTVHEGALEDVSEGGLAFVTTVSLAVGETLMLSYQEEGEPRLYRGEAVVEPVHSPPKETRFLVGVRFISPRTPRTAPDEGR